MIVASRGRLQFIGDDFALRFGALMYFELLDGFFNGRVLVLISSLSLL